MISQIYVSRSLVDPADRPRIIEDIMAISIARNTMLGITGLLIAAPNHFAQLLEGPEAALDAVMTSITADHRHTAVRVVRRARVQRARFPNWRMARFDGDNFGNTIVDPLLMAAHTGTDANAISRLERLIGEMAKDLR